MLEKMLRDNMEAALDKYSADKLGIPDYALESDGGAIHFPHHSTTFNTGTERGWFGLSFWYDTVSPRVIIQPDNKPGQCWAFQGQQGYVVIKLSRAIIPTMFTLEHIPSSLSTNGHGKIPTAPKDFSVWGWADPEGTEKVMLGNFTYKKEGKSLQTFQVKGTPSDAVFRYVELRVLSNHGQATHTCIYRLRVHGDLPPTTRP
ncbi:predicted protein [Nematostella vectensis]|uniref:SUN domain-containing protein n=1 Tax=Nematostella vectensis TaxID=45351 RepID=A7S8D4_NEMVE|nr:predicted protein [Nematostella vectensis]|eukprot:XP_001632145.1 predicted protein [Nematostella vectensis]